MASQPSHRPSHSKHAPVAPPPARGPQQPSDHLALSDLLDTPDEVASAGRAGDDLLSQMAGDSIDRMISGEFEPIVDPVDQLKDQLGNFFEELHQRQQVQSVSPKAIAPRGGAARPGGPKTGAGLQVVATPAGSATVGSATGVPEEQIEIVAPAERAALSFDEDESPLAAGADDADEGDDGIRRPDVAETPARTRALLVHDGEDDGDGVPLALQPLDWAGGVVEAMSPAGRALVSVGAVASFLAACGTLAYVLVLRQGW